MVNFRWNNKMHGQDVEIRSGRWMRLLWCDCCNISISTSKPFALVYVSKLYSDCLIATLRHPSAGQGWRYGPIRCTLSLKGSQRRCTCLTWTPSSQIFLTLSSPWPRSRARGLGTSTIVSTGGSALRSVQQVVNQCHIDLKPSDWCHPC